MRLLLLFLAGWIWVAGTARADGTNLPPVLTLADAQQIALRHHPQIAAADYRALAAEEAYEETRAGYFPTATLYADAVGANREGTRILAGGLNNPSIYDRDAGGVAVSQLISDFGHTANLAASSRSESQAQSQNASATREQILLRVDISYFSTLEAQAVLEVARQTLDTRRVLLDQVTLLESNRLKSALDVSFAQVAVQEAELLSQRAQNEAAAI